MTKVILRFIFALLGLTGLGIIVTEILGKWELLGENTNPFWIVMPIVILFLGNEFVNSEAFHTNQKLT